MFNNKLSKRITGLSLILFAIAATGIAHADELDNLQRNREVAQMRYVNEIGTGKYKTSAQQDELRQKMLDPSEKKTRDYFTSISAMPSPHIVKAEDIDLNSGPKRVLSASESSALKNGPAVKGHEIANPHEAPVVDKSTLRPEFVLDGSNVPKEIVFGAPDFASPKSAGPSPTPKKAGSH